MLDNNKFLDRLEADVIRGGGIADPLAMHGKYKAQCFDQEGNLKWEDEIDNLITFTARKDMLDKYLAGGTGLTLYMGLIGSSGWSAVSVDDTMASHAGWTESQAYSESARVTCAWSAAAGTSPTATKALSAPCSFTANASVTIKGAFLVSNSTKGGTSGTLVSCGVFSGGDKTLGSGDVLNISYTAQMTT